MPTDLHAQYILGGIVCMVFQSCWLGLSVTVRVRVGTRDREWIFYCFFSSCPKVTNTFVLPSLPGAWSNSYLAGAC